MGIAGILAGSIAVPAGIWFAGQTETSLAFIGAAVLFLPLFVFIPKLVQCAMKSDADAAIEAFGKNEHVRKVFWTFVRCDGRAGDGPGFRPGDSSAGCGGYYGDGGMR